MKLFNQGIKSGNTKLHKSCGIFNTTCHRNCSYCYMKKMSWPSTVQGWQNNKDLSKRSDFIDNTAKVINRRKYKYFRVHAMGEFDTVEYLLSWYAIAKNCPDTKFYAYSKEYDIVSFCAEHKPDNFTMIYSVEEVDDISIDLNDVKKLDFDSIARISTNSEAYKNKYVCQASKYKGNDYCMNKCTRCANRGETIILPLH